MLARGHAISGATGWLGLCVASGAWLNFAPTPLQVAAGAVVATGFALLPDLDHPNSTITHSLGPVTRVVGRIVSYVSDAVRDETCDCCDTEGTYGHRLLTHAALFAVAVGAGIGLAGWRWGTTAAAIIVGVTAWLAVLGLLARRGVWLYAALVGISVGLAVYHLGGDGWWWLGIPAGAGTLIHSLGDAITKQRSPLAAPLKIAGCRWYRIGLPKWLTFKAGGWQEQVLSVLMFGGGVFAGYLLWTG